MNSEKYTDEELLELFSNLKTPFSEEDTERSRREVLSRIQPNQSKNRGWMRIAAALVLLIGLAAVFVSISAVEITSNGETVSHVLPCGSEIVLTSGTLSYQPMTWGMKRSIQLDGQCYFDIVKGEAFTVISDMGNINVLGTSFTVFADENDLFVHCETGKVRVENDRHKFDLDPDEFCQIDEAIGLEGEASAKRARHILESTELHFENDPSNLVVLKLENWYGVEISGLTGKDHFYTGKLNGQSLEADLKVFCQTFNATFNFDEAGNVLIKN
jgi:ferric-dicitrate binding protein FerR (iron transport regulator)